MAIGTLALISAGVGLAGSALGFAQARKAARERKRELRNQKARQEAWYNRNYYEDYMNGIAAQAAIKRVRDAWAERTQAARARQAVTGGTAEQAEAVAEAGGEALASTAGNLAAIGEQNKRQVDAQKMAMDAEMSAQKGALADVEQQAGMTIAENGINTAVAAAQSLGGTGNKTVGARSDIPLPDAAGLPSGAKMDIPNKIDTRIEVPVQPDVKDILRAQAGRNTRLNY